MPGLLLTTTSRLLLDGTLTTDAFDVPLSNSTSYEVAPVTVVHVKLKVEPAFTAVSSSGDDKIGVLRVLVTLYKRETDHSPEVVPLFARTRQVYEPGVLLTKKSR